MDLLNGILATVAAADPAVLWLGAVLLPLFGVPVSPLWIALGVRLGSWWGATAATLACAANIALGFCLARGVLHARIAEWLQRRGRTLPTVLKEDEAHWILLVRVTPGIPLFIQNYLLALAGVRFGSYLLFSLPVQALYALLFASLGHSLTGTSLWRVLLLALGLVAAGLGIGLVRRALCRRRPVS